MNATAALPSDTAPVTSMDFAHFARHLASRARAQGLGVHTSFRSPPKVLGTDRSLRFTPQGAAVIAVRLKGRTAVAVLADMVDGVIAANKIGDPAEATRVRVALTEGII